MPVTLIAANALLSFLTTPYSVVTLSNMNAILLLHERHALSEGAFVEMVVWRLPSLLPGSNHVFKYRLALVVNGACVLCYDNESGKGDHRHVGGGETAYRFTTPRALLDDFWKDAEKWRS
jgi:hypothetical protein